MEAAIGSALISAFAAIAVAIITAYSNIKQRREKVNFEVREQQQIEERLLTMKLISANCKLSTVTAKAMFNHKTNGDVEDAFNSVKEAQEEYFNFINSTAAKTLSKKS